MLSTAPLLRGIRDSGPRVAWCALLAVACLLSVDPAEAQVVRGVVLGVGDGLPIADANLVLMNEDEVVVASAVSDAQGAFVLRLRAGGRFSLAVSHLGYADWETAPFDLASDVVLDLEVKLGIEAIPLEPITVIAEGTMGLGPLAAFRERMADPSLNGYFLEEDDIARRPMAKPSDLVLAFPGMSVGLASAASGIDRGVILGNGCPSRTFIDGVRVQQGAGASIDDLLPPEQIAGVEIYPRASGTPIQYLDNSYSAASGRGCGLVLFWTKPPQANGDGNMGTGRILVGVGLLLGILTLAIFG